MTTDTRAQALTRVHPNHARERLLCVFETSISIVQDADAIPQFWFLEFGTKVDMTRMMKSTRELARSDRESAFLTEKGMRDSEEPGPPIGSSQAQVEQVRKLT